MSPDAPILNSPVLFKCYLNVIRDSGDFPTRFWLPPDTFDPSLGSISLAGMNLHATDLNGTPCTLCAPIYETDWDAKWILRQVRTLP